jgi:hypothetical protein
MEAIITNITQRTPAWHQARRGRVSGSERATMLIGPEKTFRRLACEIAAELLGYELESRDLSGNENVQRGIDNEPEAFSQYLIRAGFDRMNDEVVEDCFLLHPDDDLICCSPDMLVMAADRGMEAKNPNMVNHFMHGVYGDEAISNDRIIQCQWGMFITGFQRWDFVSHHINCNTRQAVIIPIMRDDDMMRLFRRKMKLLHSEVDAAMEKMGSKF